MFIKSLKIFNSKSNFNVIKTLQRNNNKIFQYASSFSFSSQHKNSDHHQDSHGEHGSHDDHHHGEPQEYHTLKYDRISYNQKLSKETRKPYFNY